jgi:hypothetical protein
MNDEPIWNWVVDGVDRYRQVPGPSTSVDHSGNIKSVLVRPFDRDHRSIKSGRGTQTTDFLFAEFTAFREAYSVEANAGQADGFKLLAPKQGDPAFDGATLFHEEARLISDAEERIQLIS